MPLTLVSISPILEIRPPILRKESCLLIDETLRTGFTLKQAHIQLGGRNVFCDPALRHAAVLALDTGFGDIEHHEGQSGLKISPVVSFRLGRDYAPSEIVDSSDNFMRDPLLQPKLQAMLSRLVGRFARPILDKTDIAARVLQACREPAIGGNRLDCCGIFKDPDLVIDIAQSFCANGLAEADAIIVGSRYAIPLAVAACLSELCKPSGSRRPKSIHVVTRHDGAITEERDLLERFRAGVVRECAFLDVQRASGLTSTRLAKRLSDKGLSLGQQKYIFDWKCLREDNANTPLADAFVVI